jgi:prepilin-type N-terminal cleavage/methylation domain-containing protein
MRKSRVAISLRTRGFTLVELLIVILLLSIFMTFASVNWNVEAKRGKEALWEDFQINISVIREDAVSNYQNRVVEFDITTGEVRVGTLDERSGFVETGKIELSEGYHIKDVVINGRPFSTGKCYMTFRADGMVDRVILHLQGEDDDDLYSLLVNPLTAKVTGENGYSQENSLTGRNNPS